MSNIFAINEPPSGGFLFFTRFGIVPSEHEEIAMGHTVNASEFSDNDIARLDVEFKTFVERLRPRWLRENNRPPQAWVLYELDAGEQQRVRGVIQQWEQYITPIAERWWKRRGFGIRWPDDASKPCQVYRLPASAA